MIYEGRALPSMLHVCSRVDHVSGAQGAAKLAAVAVACIHGHAATGVSS